MKIDRQTILRHFSVFNPWHNIRIMGKNVPVDLLSGLTVAVIALPLALAFGVASGLGPIAGVWGAICGGIFVGLFGGSRTAVSGPTGPMTVLLASLMVSYKLPDGSPDAAFAFGVVALSGLIMIIIAFLKIGRFIYYTPYSVISGFMCGIGVIIISLQINPFFGLPSLSSVGAALAAVVHLPTSFQTEATVVSLATLTAILLWQRTAWVTWLPGPLVGLIIGTGLANIFNFDIAYIGDIPTGLPHLHLPDWSRIGLMIGPAMAVAGLSFFDSLMTCLVADNMTGDRHSSNREILGEGIANLTAGLIGGLPSATATMRTVANIKCGAQTSLAAVTHGVVLLLLVLGLAPLASHIPMACLAGILIKIGIDILDYRVIPILSKMPLTDKLCFWIVLIATVTIDLLVAVGIGLVVAFFRFVQEMSDLYKNEVVSLKDIEDPWPGEDLIPDAWKERILILRPEGPLFFGTSNTLFRAIKQMMHYDILIIRLRRVPMIDLSGAFALEDIIDRAKSKGTVVLLTGLNNLVRETLQQLGIIDKVGGNHCFERFDDAISEIKNILAHIKKGAEEEN